MDDAEDRFEILLTQVAKAFGEIVEKCKEALKMLEAELALLREDWSAVVEVLPRKGDAEDKEMFGICPILSCKQATMHRHENQPAVVLPRLDPEDEPYVEEHHEPTHMEEQHD